MTNTLLCPAIIRTYLVPSFPYRRFRATVAVQATALPEASLFLGLQLTGVGGCRQLFMIQTQAEKRGGILI